MEGVKLLHPFTYQEEEGACLVCRIVLYKIFMYVNGESFNIWCCVLDICVVSDVWNNLAFLYLCKALKAFDERNNKKKQYCFINVDLVRDEEDLISKLVFRWREMINEIKPWSNNETHRDFVFMSSNIKGIALRDKTLPIH